MLTYFYCNWKGPYNFLLRLNSLDRLIFISLSKIGSALKLTAPFFFFFPGLQELLAIQQQGPRAIGFFGTRNMGFMHQELIEILSYAMVITVRA